MKIKLLILCIIFSILINIVFAQTNVLSLNINTNQASYENGDTLTLSYSINYRGTRTIPIDVSVSVQFPNNEVIDITPNLERSAGVSYSNIQLPPGFYAGDIFDYTFEEEDNLPAGRYTLRVNLTDSNSPGRTLLIARDETTFDYLTTTTQTPTQPNYQDLYIEFLSPSYDRVFFPGDSFTILARQNGFMSNDIRWQIITLNREPVTVQTTSGPQSSGPMFDDGNHGDGGRGDGVYGSSAIGTVGMQLGWYDLRLVSSLPSSSEQFAISLLFEIAEEEVCPDEYDVAFVMIYENPANMPDYVDALNSIKTKFLAEINTLTKGRLVLNIDPEFIILPKQSVASSFRISERPAGRYEEFLYSNFYRDFYVNSPYINRYDELVVYTDFDEGKGGPGGAWHRTIRNNVAGIGLRVMDFFPNQADKRLLAINFMKNIGFKYDPFWGDLASDAEDRTLIHELFHTWLFFVKNPSNFQFTKDGAHLRTAVNVNVPLVNGGAHWRELQDGVFQRIRFNLSVPHSESIEKILLYLAGLSSENIDVNEKLWGIDYFDEAEFNNTLFSDGKTVRGVRRELSLDYIIQTHGERRCVDI